MNNLNYLSSNQITEKGLVQFIRIPIRQIYTIQIKNKLKENNNGPCFNIMKWNGEEKK